MNQVITHIEELLYRHQCVVVPSLGAFITNRKSAYITKDGVFMPPYKEVIFNSSLTANDGLLISHISEADSISYERAEGQVKEFVVFCREKLSQRQWVELGTLGYFKQEGGFIVFEASHKTNFLLDSFGLEGFLAQKIHHKSNETPKKRVYIWQNYAKYAAVFVLGLMSLFSGGMTYLDYLDIEKNSIHNTYGVHYSSVNEASFFADVPLKLPSIKLNAVKNNTENQSVDANFEKHKVQYYAIAGVFKSKKNAEKKLQQILSQGYKAEIIGQNRLGNYQVSYQGFETYSQALQFSKRIRQNNNLDSWILEIKSGK